MVKAILRFILIKCISRMTIFMLIVFIILALKGFTTLGLILYAISEILQYLFNTAYEIT